VAEDPIIREVLADRHCRGCVVRDREDLVKVRDRALDLKTHCVPSTIEKLLVSESPPTKMRVQPECYFYAPGKILYGTLDYFTMSVLFGKEMKSYKTLNKEYFLEKFRSEGFFLIDMVKCPIDKLLKSEKMKAIESCAKYLERELHALKFGRIIVIGKGSFKIVSKRLNLGFSPVILPLPFSSRRNVESYMAALKRAVRQQPAPTASQLLQ
jgi:hypothetical protein